jgi:hypothetical protein
VAQGSRVALVSDLWRFPVKSFGGERLRRGFVGPFGLLGDRRHAVVDESGQALTARRARALLGFRARYLDPEAGDELEVTTPAGRVCGADAPELADELTAALGRPVRLVRAPTGVHDAAPIHMVSSASLLAIGAVAGHEELDRRRFRANLVVEMEDERPFAEADWVGRTLEIEDGPAFDVVSPTERCAVTTFDPDTLERDTRVLTALATERENLFGLYAMVARPGWVAVGAALHLGARVSVPSAPR